MILIKLLTENPPPHLLKIASEIGFLMGNEKKLHLHKHYSKAKIIDFLANAVARKPQDLRLHTQRLFQHLEYKDCEPIYGVLLDLFIALGNQGLPIKKRMLNLSKPFLSETQIEVFRVHHGLIEPHTPVLTSTHSILSLGYTGTNKLLYNAKIAVTEQQNKSTKPLRTAVAYIRQGHLDPAQKLLEKAVLEGNILKQTHQKLLDIYVFTKNEQDCKKIKQKISPKLTQPMLALWQSTLTSIQTNK